MRRSTTGRGRSRATKPARKRRRSCSCTASTGTTARATSSLNILKGAELAIWPGQSVALVAPSGAGKSTLLHVAGLLEHPDAGEVYIDQVADITALGCRAHAHPAHRDRLRLPVPPPADGVLRARERDHAADDPRAVAPGSGSTRDRSAGLSRAQGPSRPTGRRSFRAASSSGSRSRARSPTRRAFCSPTSRPEISTRAPPSTCSPRSPSWCRPPGSRSWWRPTTWTSPARMDRRVTLRDGLVMELE